MTEGVKYIGSKRELVEHIEKVIPIEYESFLDAFTGTTRVAQYFRHLQKTVYTSDLSWASTIYSNTYLGDFDSEEIQHHLDIMNNLPAVEGWLTKNYTGEHDGERSDGRCFQRHNTVKADAARDYVETLPERIRPPLITSIIRALDAVDNTVGIQQAYLKEWCSRSYKNIEFVLPQLIDGPRGHHFEGDALEIEYPQVDVAYFDPPYSPHQYSTYYHIWDSIAKWDKPETDLKARRRVDRVVGHDDFDGSMKSLWNSPKTALEAFSLLIDRVPAKCIVISYSNESIVDLDSLMEACKRRGEVALHEIDYKRNIMSQIGNATKNAVPEKSQRNIEYLIVITT